jgi:hypothetical protein
MTDCPPTRPQTVARLTNRGRTEQERARTSDLPGLEPDAGMVPGSGLVPGQVYHRLQYPQRPQHAWPCSRDDERCAKYQRQGSSAGCPSEDVQQRSSS